MRQVEQTNPATKSSMGNLALGPLIFLVAASFGCSFRTFSPPTRPVPLEDAQTAGAGNTGIQAEGGAAVGVFESSFVHGGVRVRHGVSETVDVSGEANFAVFLDDSSWHHRGLYSLRVGAKFGLGDYFAVGAGIGGGGSAAGGFLGPDLALIASYTNPYVIPFANLRGSLSVPIGATPIYGEQCLDDAVTECTREASVFDTPELSWMVQITFGMRVPLVRPNYAYPEEDAVGFDLLLGTSLSHIFDASDREPLSMFNITLGAELRL